MKQEFEGGEPVSRRLHEDPNKEMLAKRAGKRGKCEIKIDLMGTRPEDRCLTTEEQEALDRFKKKDEQIDDMLVMVIQDIDLLKEKAVKIDQAIDRNAEKLQNVDKHASKTSAQLETINTRMKDILKKASPCIYLS
ncbi:MAG: hypothetical protein P4L67_00765 [Candidatus Pacebacteria bacterium]|nr:hypothetical protein [Candidatus Paceibacterota bacterium]